VGIGMTKSNDSYNNAQSVWVPREGLGGEYFELGDCLREKSIGVIGGDDDGQFLGGATIS